MEATNSNLTSPSKQTSRLSTNARFIHPKYQVNFIGISETTDQLLGPKPPKKMSEDLTCQLNSIPQSRSINSRLNDLKRKRFPTLTPLQTSRSNYILSQPQEIRLQQFQSLCMPLIPQTNFKKLCNLSSGYQALGCFKCIDLRTNQYVVVKEIKNNDEEICLQFKAEYKFIKKLSHENIVKAIELIMELDSCQIVMEYAEGKPLMNYLSKLNETAIINIAQQLFSALGYLHENNIMHRDLHFNNIVYEKKNEKIKIIDFGIAKKLRDKVFGASCAGGVAYRAPEMLNYQPYTCKVDCWQIGLILLQLVNHKKITSQRIIKKIENQQKIIKNSNISIKLQKLIEQLLIINPENRYSAKEALDFLSKEY